MGDVEQEKATPEHAQFYIGTRSPKGSAQKETGYKVQCDHEQMEGNWVLAPD